MAYTRPQSMYRQQRGALAGYQYRNMNRYVPKQIRSWASASGNPYTVAQWRTRPPQQVEQDAYFNNVLMQRLGGDWSLKDRMGANYYNPVQYAEGWRNAPTWQPGLQGWSRERLQGNYEAMGPQQQSYQGGDLTYTIAQGQNRGKTYASSREALLAALGVYL